MSRPLLLVLFVLLVALPAPARGGLEYHPIHGNCESPDARPAGPGPALSEEGPCLAGPEAPEGLLSAAEARRRAEAFIAANLKATTVLRVVRIERGCRFAYGVDVKLGDGRLGRLRVHPLTGSVEGLWLY